MSAGRSVANVFHQYQLARAQFAQQVADLASRPENLEQLIQGNVIVLLRNLLTDVAPSVQQNAAIAIGRLASHCPKISELLIKYDIVRIMLYFNMDKSNKYLKRAALMAIRSIVKHSAALAKSVIDIGGLDQIVSSLEEFDPGVKEGACWVLGYMARHDVSLAYNVIAAGAVPLLILCLQEPEMSVRQVAASALSDICKHSPETAQVILETGGINHLTRALTSTDPKLKRQTLNALASIAKQSTDMAETILESNKLQTFLENCGHPDESVRKAACALIREVVKHSPEMAQMVVEAGGLGVIVNAVAKNHGEAKLPGIMTLGFIAGHSPELALSVVYSKGVEALSQALEENAENHVGAAAAWSLGHIARHSTEHAKHVTKAGVLAKILRIYTCNSNNDEMKDKAKEALKMILLRTDDLNAVEPLLTQAPPRILKYIIAQYSKVLPCDPKARRAFVTTGGLRKVQELLNTMTDNSESTAVLREHIALINQCFPDDVVKYFSPNYPSTLLERVESFKPTLNIDPSLWSERLFSNVQIPADVKEELLALQQSIGQCNPADIPAPPPPGPGPAGDEGLVPPGHAGGEPQSGHRRRSKSRDAKTHKRHPQQQTASGEAAGAAAPAGSEPRRPSKELKQPHGGKKLSTGSTGEADATAAIGNPMPDAAAAATAGKVRTSITKPKPEGGIAQAGAGSGGQVPALAPDGITTAAPAPPNTPQQKPKTQVTVPPAK